MLRLDADIAQEVRAAGCPCGGRLHTAAFPRKPRGLPPGSDSEALDHRPSFCCDRDGCRRRVTPPSVIFLGRRVYLGAVVVLTAALRHGPTHARVQTLAALIGASVRTVKRWLAWWRERFTATPLWRTLAGRVVLHDPAARAELPWSLLVAAGAAVAEGEALVRVMQWLLPLTARTGPPSGSRFARLF